MSQSHAPSETHAADMRRGQAPPTRPSEPDGTKRQQEGTQGKQSDAIWQSIKADLHSIKEGLEKEEGNTLHIQRLAEVIARGSQAYSTDAAHGLEARLERIETLLMQTAAAPQGVHPGKKTWADITATGVRQAGAPQAIQPTRHTVRVQLAQAKGLANVEILKEIKKTITGATAIRVLQSGAIDVTVPDETTKDRAQGLPSTEGLKIFKRDYLIEIPGVPLTVRVACEKGADNSQLADAISAASKNMTPGLQITRIRWLHDQKKRGRNASETQIKTRGSLIIGFHTQEMQRRAIQGGLVIDAQLFEARPFEKDLLAVRCFKCQAWGHTQSVCRKPVRCGQCAGAHDSRQCPGERTSCANCGQQHRAWQQRECPTSQAYHQGIQNRRIALYSQATSIRSAPFTFDSHPQNPPSQTGNWTTITRKRPRLTPLGPAEIRQRTSRQIGRPTHVEQAARDPSQHRLSFEQNNAGESQETSMRDAPRLTSVIPDER